MATDVSTIIGYVGVGFIFAWLGVTIEEDGFFQKWFKKVFILACLMVTMVIANTAHIMPGSGGGVPMIRVTQIVFIVIMFFTGIWFIWDLFLLFKEYQKDMDKNRVGLGDDGLKGTLF